MLYGVICGVQEVSLRRVMMRRCWRRGHVPFRPAFVWILLLRFKISLKLRLSGGAASCFISFLSVQRAYFNTNLSDMTGPPPACGHSPQPCDITGVCCLPESKRALNVPSALPFQLDAALPLRSDDVSCDLMMSAAVNVLLKSADVSGL